MKLSALIFAFLMFSTIKAMILVGAAPEDIVFPEMPVMEPIVLFEFESFSTEDSGFRAIATAVQNVAEAVRVIAVNVINFGKFLLLLAAFIVQLIGFIALHTFSTVEGVPALVNLVVVGIPGFMLVLIVYKLVRRGSSES